MLRAVELAGDQTAIPSQDGFRLGNTGYLRQTLPPEPLADFGERRPFGVGKPQSSGGVGAKNSILRNQIFALEVRIPMMSISHSDLMPIRTERSDAGLSQCEIVIDIRQEFCWFSLS
jgi:hypothetical protein